MSNKTTRKADPRVGSKTRFQVKPVFAGEVAGIVLEELSLHYGDCCNYLEAARLVRQGHPFLAYASIEQQNGGRAVTSPRQHWVHSQALSVVKKLVDSDVDRWPLTKAKWFSTEERCRKLNLKFAAILKRKNSNILRPDEGKSIPFSPELYRFYEALVYVLGVAPPEDEIVEAAHYGPGSTVSIRGRAVHYARKVEAEECVPLAVDLAAKALCFDKAAWAHVGMDPVYSNNEDAQAGFVRVMRERLMANVVKHDRLMFIHKNITSLRSIGAQPTCSGMLQLGVHTVLAPYLKRVNVHLDDQSWNQKLAYLGSKDWDSSPDPFCTLDKTDASNLICKNLVSNLFPPAWAKLLTRIRTPGYIAPPEMGGGEFEYEMYAGMGNGTTFAVETLVFWAASYATSDAGSVESYVNSGEFAIYGDDVVLRRSHALRYMKLARYLGFRFNDKKTFLDGPFRESCGSDFYAGVPVRAATLDSETGVLNAQDLIGFHNTLADNTTFALPGACRRIRKLFREFVFPSVPTDPQGNLGFRPLSSPHYSLVKKNDGTVLVSPAWQRPRTYMLEVRPQYADLGELDSWTQIAVSLLRARQSFGPTGHWSLPARKLVNIRVIPEQDLNRRDLGLMLRNQLARLAVRKAAPWWNASRGTSEGK